MTNEELENKIRVIEHDLTKEISTLKEKLYKMEVRFESLVRYFIWEGDLSKTVFTVERYQEAVMAFQVLNAKIIELRKLPSITEKVMAAEEFNNSIKITKAKIYADDLGLREIIENAGGTSSMTAMLILSALPCSKELTHFLQSFVIPDNLSNKVIEFPKKVMELEPGKDFPS